MTPRNPFARARTAGRPEPSASETGTPNPLPIPPPGFANDDASTPSARPPAPPLTSASQIADDKSVDLRRRRDQLTARVAELQWDLGGLVYEMAVRDRIRVDVIVKRAAVLQEADAELGEVERILKLEETGTAGACSSCGAPHSTGASYCWQCGQPLLAQVAPEAIARP